MEISSGLLLVACVSTKTSNTSRTFSKESNILVDIIITRQHGDRIDLAVEEWKFVLLRYICVFTSMYACVYAHVCMFLGRQTRCTI